MLFLISCVSLWDIFNTFIAVITYIHGLPVVQIYKDIVKVVVRYYKV